MNSYKNGLLGIIFLMQTLILANPIEFEIIIPSYNNERWCVGNLLSAVRQKYPHFHITYIDDCSTDATGTLVDAFIKTHNLQDKITVVHNAERKGALENLYNAIHACEDHKVIVTLDGDDMLAHEDVLHKLEEIYSKYNVWITYGQFQEWPNGHIGFCDAIPDDIVKKGAFRSHLNLPSHLRTFYAWLFKKIKRDDLIYRDTFYEMTWDQAMMFPMMEMAGERHAFIPEVLYSYNAINSISDHRVNKGLQGMLAQVIRSKTPYTRLPEQGETVQKHRYTPPAPKPAMTHKEKREYYKQVKKALKRKLNL